MRSRVVFEIDVGSPLLVDLEMVFEIDTCRDLEMVFEIRHIIPGEEKVDTGTESINILLLNITKSYKILITSLSSDGGESQSSIRA